MSNRRKMTRKRLLEPIHPGEILLEEFMKPLAISINRLACEIHVLPGRISAIVNRKRATFGYLLFVYRGGVVVWGKSITSDVRRGLRE